MIPALPGNVIRRLLAEPLLHFLILGAALFATYAILSKGGPSAPDRIVVTQGQIETMAALFARNWQRPPSDEELEGLIRGYVREEVLYREGLALGLDRDDPMIRRRIGQKLEFVAEGAEAAEPSEEQLQAFLDSHGAAFAAEPRSTFRQVYLDPRRHAKTLAADADRMLVALNRPGGAHDADDLGDPTLLPPRFENAAASEVSKALGSEFATALARLEPGRWQGPLVSGYGAHLVQVTERVEARNPVLAEVRDAVKREWESNRRAEGSEKLYRKLLARYTVILQGPRLTQGAGDIDRSVPR
jgi:parvulin-like peptidyl-prolyl cis-trans isomerase-like protein